MADNHNIPAFPASVACTPAGDAYHGLPGMSLRDWFAGQALAGIVANPETPDQLICLGFKGSKDLLAEYAYAAADAMLAARSESGGE